MPSRYGGDVTRADLKLLDRYLAFWREVNSLLASHQFFIFFNFVSPNAGEFDARTFFKPIEKTVKSLDPEFDRHLFLSELGCIQREDVKEWLNATGVLEEEKWDDWCGALFNAENCLPMRVVEPRLKALCQREPEKAF